MWSWSGPVTARARTHVDLQCPLKARTHTLSERFPGPEAWLRPYTSQWPAGLVTSFDWAAWTTKASSVPCSRCSSWTAATATAEMAENVAWVALTKVFFSVRGEIRFLWFSNNWVSSRGSLQDPICNANLSIFIGAVKVRNDSADIAPGKKQVREC